MTNPKTESLDTTGQERALSDHDKVDALAKAFCLLDSFAGDGLGHVYGNGQTIDADDTVLELCAAFDRDPEPGWWRALAADILALPHQPATDEPPAAETRLRDVLSLADAEKIAGDKPNAHHDNCTCDDCMYYMSRVDGVQLGYAAALTQPEPTAQQATTYQSAADCPLGSAHGTASTHGNADGVQCCDWCGFPVSAQQGGEEAAVHMADCNQGEYAGECKYGDSDCPALSAQQAAGEAVAMQCPECGMGRPGHKWDCPRAPVLTLGPRTADDAAPQPEAPANQAKRMDDLMWDTFREAEAPAEVQQGVASYRHKKRGTIYEVVGEATLQCAANPALDEQPLVIYRGEDGMLWARGVTEFHDGRFEALATPQQGQEVEG